MSASEPNLSAGASADPLAAQRRADALAEGAWRARRDDPARALELAEAALEAAAPLPYPRGVAAASVAKAFACFRLGRLGDARESAEAGRDLFRALGDPPGLARALNTLGIVYGESGELLGSLEAFLNAQVVFGELADREGEADALNNIGNVYAYLGDYVNALDFHQQSLAVCEAEGFAQAGRNARLNIGTSYHELGQFREAVDHLADALTPETEADPYAHALCLLNLGRSYARLGEPGRAGACLGRSLALSRELGDPLGTSYALDNLAALELEAGGLSGARGALQESLALKEAAGDPRGQSETLLLLADADRRGGDLPGAARRLRRVLALTESVGNPLERCRAFGQLSEVCEQEGDFERALACSRRYHELLEGVSGRAVEQRLQGLRLRFEVSQGAREREIYRQKNAELARLNAELQGLNRALGEADAEKTRLLEVLSRQAEEDALTGLYNRRHFDEAFSRSFAQAKRLQTPLSVVICDIDDFKRINDRFSHAVGDAVLKAVAGIMRRGLRAVDTVARYGGEEFVMSLPGSGGGDALAVCERLRAAAEAYNWDLVSPGLRVTLSVGVSDDLGAGDHERMLALADAKLYEAKRGGKNRVCR